MNPPQLFAEQLTGTGEVAFGQTHDGVWVSDPAKRQPGDRIGQHEVKDAGAAGREAVEVGVEPWMNQHVGGADSKAPAAAAFLVAAREHDGGVGLAMSVPWDPLAGSPVLTTACDVGKA